jgi:hypothetical protein
MFPLAYNSLSNKSEKSIDICNNRGQTLIEFIFLFVILVIISTGFISTVQGHIADMWEFTVNIIIKDNDPTLRLRIP